jgi:hypothetical protein
MVDFTYAERICSALIRSRGLLVTLAVRGAGMVSFDHLLGRRGQTVS